jgi:hypothetical protein
MPSQFGGQTFSRVTQNRLAGPYERVTGMQYPWYYYEPETPQQRSRRLRIARERERIINTILMYEQLEQENEEQIRQQRLQKMQKNRKLKNMYAPNPPRHR